MWNSDSDVTPHGTRNGLLALAALALLPACRFAGEPAAPGASFGPLEPWARPIEDAIAVGEAAFPNGFRRNITTLRAHGGRLWMGYGDGTANLGTETPIEFRWFANADDPTPRAARVLAEGQGALQRTPTDTGEEQIDPMRLIDGTLWMAGSDSVQADEDWTQAKDPRLLIEGNVFRLEDSGAEPAWQKLRTVGGGEHVHDLVGFEGDLYAVGSGADVRAEFGVGEVFRYLWRSTDQGNTFETVARFRCPEPGRDDTRFRRLLPVGDRLLVFGYVVDYVNGGQPSARNAIYEGGELRELEGVLADEHVTRTWSLGAEIGLAVARRGDGDRSYLVGPDGARELETWRGLRIVDLVPEGSTGAHLVLVADEDGGEVLRLAGEATVLGSVLRVEGVQPTAMAVFDGALFVGTQDGQVHRALAAR
jgi:hypothetical protein